LPLRLKSEQGKYCEYHRVRFFVDVCRAVSPANTSLHSGVIAEQVAT
jgi:hypothetical protein